MQETLDPVHCTETPSLETRFRHRKEPGAPVRRVTLAVAVAALVQAGSALAALQLRDIDGKATTIAADTEFAHDTVLDATWCLTANNTSLPWGNAKSWAAGLTVVAFSGWSLPAADPSCGLSYLHQQPDGRAVLHGPW